MKIRVVLSALALASVLLSPACKPAPETSVSTLPLPNEPEATPNSGSIVSIPEEFQAPPAETPQATLPPVVFVTSDFTISSSEGLRGIRVGEAMNFIRQEGDDFIVQTDGLEFQKNKSFFSSTYIPPTIAAPEAEAPIPTPLPTPVAEVQPTPDTITDGPAPATTDNSYLADPSAQSVPTPTAEEEKVGKITDTIRNLNEEIRTSQDALSTKSKQPSPPSTQEVKKEKREIDRLKAERDALSESLTELGKP